MAMYGLLATAPGLPISNPQLANCARTIGLDSVRGVAARVSIAEADTASAASGAARNRCVIYGPSVGKERESDPLAGWGRFPKGGAQPARRGAAGRSEVDGASVERLLEIEIDSHPALSCRAGTLVRVVHRVVAVHLRPIDATQLGLGGLDQRDVAAPDAV